MARARDVRQADSPGSEEIPRTRFDRDDLIRATNTRAEFTGPALVLWSRNPSRRPSTANGFAPLPDSQLRHIDDAYLRVMLDQPARTAMEIRAFLRGDGRE